MEKIITDKSHYLVDISMQESDPCGYRFNSIHEAVMNMHDGTEKEPFTIYLMPGVYKTKGTPSSVGLTIEHDWVRLIGLGDNPDDVVIYDNRGHMVNSFPYDNGANSPAQTMIVNGNGFYCENLTIGNYLNVDMVYKRDESQNIEHVSDVITQAYAIGSTGKYDDWVFKNCRIEGRLDTLSFCHKNVRFIDSFISGTKDFLGGGDLAVYDNCLIEIYDTCPMYMAGCIATMFKNCIFKVELEDYDVVYFTKYGGELIFDNCSFTGNVKTIEWALEPRHDARNYVRNITLNGEKLVISQGKPFISVEITDEMLLPSHMELLTELELKLTQRERIYDEDTFPILKYDESIDLYLETFPAIDDYTVTISKDAVYEKKTDRITVTNKNSSDKREEITLSIEKNGVIAVKTLECLPKALGAPKYTVEPGIIMANDVLKVEYELDMQGYEDASLITWYRKGTDGELTELANSNCSPCRQYRPVQADVGSTIVVSVEPRYKDGLCGDKHDLEYKCDYAPDMVKLDDMPHMTCYRNELIEGDLFFYTYRPLYDGVEVDHVANWIPGDGSRALGYERGHDGAKERYGLKFKERGAAIAYHRGKYVGPCKMMLELCPDKDTGEGFGSANGQYIEIFIKYDITTKNGYGLRIERVPNYAHGCQFSLRKYTNGKNELISDSVMSSCFITPCVVEIEYDSNKLSAVVQTSFSQLNSARKDRVAEKVLLSAEAADSGYGDVQLHFTGTVPSGNQTLISKMEIEY